MTCCPEPDSVPSCGLLLTRRLAGLDFPLHVLRGYALPRVSCGGVGGKWGGDSVLLLGQSGRKVEAEKRMFHCLGASWARFCQHSGMHMLASGFLVQSSELCHFLPLGFEIVG